MGTSTGYNLPTTGNWPSMKGKVTSFGASGGNIAGGVGGLLNDYVQARGGPHRAAQQMSAAIRTGARLGGFLADVQRNGLKQALIDAGLGELVGRPLPDVLRGLRDYFVGPSSLLDDDIVYWAYSDYQDEEFGVIGSLEEFESALSQLLTQDGIGLTLRRFFGFCIYRRFLTDFAERLMKAAGGARAAKRLYSEVKEFIFTKLKVLTHGHDAANVDWRGVEGQSLSQRILTSVWQIFGET